MVNDNPVLSKWHRRKELTLRPASLAGKLPTVRANRKIIPPASQLAENSIFFPTFKYNPKNYAHQPTQLC